MKIESEAVNQSEQAAAWAKFAGPAGALGRLEAEQEGDLGGPRPQPAPPPEPGSGAAVGLCGLGAHLFSGQDLLSMLKGMHIAPGAQAGMRLNST